MCILIFLHEKKKKVQIIKQCLDTHNKLVSTEMRPFHKTLTECKFLKKKKGFH